MVRKLLPLLLLLLGTGAGFGIGTVLAPPADQHGAVEAAVQGEGDQVAMPEPAADPETGAPGVEYVKLNNQFVVPVVERDQVTALVVLSLNIEVPSGQTDVVYAREPKLRDTFLQVLFEHANIGGFHGSFTNANTLDTLRNALREAARNVAGAVVLDVLIVDIARQDV